MMHVTSMKCLSILVLLVFAGVAAASQKIVETVPGYPGKLPFKLETGYIGIGEMDEIQLFYYFIESERNPSLDPLLFWLTGGPGCSGFSALAFETGPLTFDYAAYNGSMPKVITNPYSWTKVASIIYIDAPVGAGFSYSTTVDGWNTSDTLSAHQSYTFLRKWLMKHPQFMGNQLYIGGDSYSGIIVPMLVTHVLEGIQAGFKPLMELQGYILGNPVTDDYSDPNSRIPYVHRVNLISDEYYQDAKEACGGDYVNTSINNTKCTTIMQSIRECLLQINLCQILEPQCAFSSKKPIELQWDRRVLEAEVVEHFLSSNKLPELPCRGFHYVMAYKWLNDVDVQVALGVRLGTVDHWERCPKTFPTYTENVSSSVPYHKNLSTTGLRALIYSGDHDISVPYIGTLEWIRALGVPVFDEWRPWYLDGQVAGYQVKFMNNHFRLTYVTLKGAGHTAPEYKPKEAQAMVDRFFARYPI